MPIAGIASQGEYVFLVGMFREAKHALVAGISRWSEHALVAGIGRWRECEILAGIGRRDISQKVVVTSRTSAKFSVSDCAQAVFGHRCCCHLRMSFESALAGGRAAV